MLKKAVLTLAALTLATSTSLAVTDVYLVAKEYTKTVDPDGAGPLPAEAITMWGFALDADCDLSTDDLEVATSPGPAIMVPPNDPNFRIFLRNDLPVPVSVVIPGQKMPWSGGNNGPTWGDDTVGSRPNLTARVRSFGREAAANGGEMSYRWTTTRNNPLQPGTYLYQSGTNPALQVQMGLYGALAKDEAAGFAYAGIGYASAVTLVYSEIDPALHDPPTAANPSNYNPRYFLVNGELFDPADPGSQRLSGLLPAEETLVRFLNAGLQSHAPTIAEGYLDLVAEDGKPYPDARQQYSTLLAAGKTVDAVLRADRPGSYPIFDRRLALTNGPGRPGGLVSYLELSDTVEIVRVRYNNGVGELRVWANSDGLPVSVLTVDECGGGTMDSFGANFDYRQFCTVANPGSATVTSDRGGSDSRAVGYTAPPTANDDTFSAAAPGSVLDNDRKGGYFAAADTLAAVLVNDASYGTVALNPDGTFTYTPTVTGPCRDSFTYRAVANGTVESSVATVTINN